MDDDKPVGGEVIDLWPHGKKPPVRYSDALAEEIFEAYATSPRGLFTLCQMKPHWPSYMTICRWRLDRPAFNETIQLAKLIRFEMFSDQMIEIADDNSDDIVDGIPNPVSPRRSDLRIKARDIWLHTHFPERFARGEGLRPDGYLPQDEAIKLLK